MGVLTLAPNGEYVDGFARRTQLEYPFPGQNLPTSPAQALEQQEQNAELYPDGVDIPVYECDGVTQVGTFHVE